MNLYVPVVPLAPLEELHASSVQHPRFQTMRWLLHTRRVPISKVADANASDEERGDVRVVSGSDKDGNSIFKFGIV